MLKRCVWQATELLLLLTLVATAGGAAAQSKLSETGLFSALDWNMTKVPPDIYYEMHLLTPETIRYRGYECEEHKVTTQDGYVLTLHRVLSSRTRRGKQDEVRPAVFLQHGLMDSSFTWVNNLAHQSLAFILVDNGFDVWLGNTRGNKYSRQHRSLSPDTEAFWDWDYDQLASFDVSASVDFVSQMTGQSQISWVGHSQGCLIALAGFINETVASKIKLFIALAPAARVDHIENELMLKIAPYGTNIVDFLKRFGWKGEFMPNDRFLTWLGGTICSDLPIICEETINFLSGYNSPDINATRLPVYYTHYPAGTSGRNMIHYAQAIEQAKFQHFDFGPVENLKRYHSFRPPEYDLKSMKVPTAVIWGTEDKLADPTDVKWITSQLPNLVLDGHREFRPRRFRARHQRQQTGIPHSYFLTSSLIPVVI